MFLIDYVPPKVEQVIEMKVDQLYLDEIPYEAQLKVKRQLEQYDDELLTQMKMRLNEKDEIGLFDPEIAPAKDVISQLTDAQKERGAALFKEGKIGCLVLAGGQGSRFGFNGPKGCIEVSPIASKSLFQLICEKVKGASHLAGRDLHLAIMTSPLNHDATVDYFEENAFFGLNRNFVTFFSQEMLPFFDKEGELFLNRVDHLAEGPNGNGYALYRFYETGVLAKWQKEGVEYVNVIPVDNPLASPFNSEVIGLHDERGDEIVFNAVAKRSPTEGVGVIGHKGGIPLVIEYSELPKEEAERVNDEGELIWRAANSALFSASLSYIERIGRESAPMPWHLAVKKGKRVVKEGDKFKTEPLEFYKFEAFIFDAFRFTDSFSVYLADRTGCFSPIKRVHGSDSLDSARADLSDRDKKLLKSLAGIEGIAGDCELDPALYYLSDGEKKGIADRLVNKNNYFTFER